MISVLLAALVSFDSWSFTSAPLSPDESTGVVAEGGALQTRLPSRRACCYWDRNFKVESGRGVKVSAVAEIEPLDGADGFRPWNDVMMFVTFYDAKKGYTDRVSFFKASYARYTDESAGVRTVRRFEDVFDVPVGCDAVKIEFVSKWHAMKVAFSEVRVQPVDAPRPRKVRCVVGNPFEKRPEELGLDGWSDPKAVMKARIGQIESCLKRIFAEVEKPDMVLFSEMFVSTGCPDPKVLAEKIPGGPSFELASRYAKAHRCYIAMNPKEVTDEGTYHNCLFLVDRDGKLVGKQHKTTLTSGEFKDGILPDDDYRVFECDFGRVGSLICWENWFSETAKYLKRRGAELLLFPLAGCAADHVDIVFPARAIDTGIPFMVAMRQRHLPNGIIDRDGSWIAKTMEDGGYAWADIDLNERKRTFWLSVGPGGGDPNELYFDESRPEIYSKQPYGPRK